jgi:anti-anti-sigma factor
MYHTAGGAVPLLNVALVPAPDQVVVRLTGEADLSSAPLLVDALRRAGRLGTRQVVVDVAAVRFWDLSGLYALTEFTADLAAERRSCRIVGAPAATRRLIALANLAGELNLDGPVRELPTPGRAAPARRPLHEHVRRPRPQASGELVSVGARPSTPDRRFWRRRG